MTFSFVYQEPPPVTLFPAPTPEIMKPPLKIRRVLHLSIDQPGKVWVQYDNNETTRRHPLGTLEEAISGKVTCKISRFGKRFVHDDKIVQRIYLVGFEKELMVVIPKGWRDVSALYPEDNTVFDFDAMIGDWRTHRFIAARLDLAWWNKK